MMFWKSCEPASNKLRRNSSGVEVFGASARSSTTKKTRSLKSIFKLFEICRFSSSLPSFRLDPAAWAGLPALKLWLSRAIFARPSKSKALLELPVPVFTRTFRASSRSARSASRFPSAVLKKIKFWRKYFKVSNLKCQDCDRCILKILRRPALEV